MLRNITKLIKIRAKNALHIFTVILSTLSIISFGYEQIQSEQILSLLIVSVIVMPLLLSVTILIKRFVVDVFSLTISTALVAYVFYGYIDDLIITTITAYILIFFYTKDRTAWEYLEGEQEVSVDDFNNTINTLTINQENYDKLISFCYQNSNLDFLDLVLTKFLGSENIQRRNDFLELRFILWGDLKAIDVLTKNNIIIENNKKVLMRDFLFCLKNYCYEEKAVVMTKLYTKVKTIDSLMHEHLIKAKLKDNVRKFINYLEISSELPTVRKVKNSVIKI